MTEWCKTRITALALADQITNYSSYPPSLVNATPRYLNFSTCFNDSLPTRRAHWTVFLKTWSISDLEVLIFIPEMSHAAEKLFDACQRSDSEEASKTKSFAKTIFASSDRDTIMGSA